MTCEQVDAEIDRRLEAGVTDLSAHARSHLTGCSRCRLLYGDRFTEAPPIGSSSWNQRILDRMAPSLTAVTPVPGFSVCLLRSVGLLAAMAAVPLAVIGVPALSHMTVPQLWAAVSLLAIAALSGSFLLAKQMSPATKQWLGTRSGAALFAAVVLLVNLAVFPWRQPGAGVALSWECLLKELAVAAPGSFVFWIMLRRAAVLSAGAKGAAIGAMAGLLGVIVLQFGCIHQQAMHLLLWHWSAITVTAAAGGLLGRFFGEPFSTAA